MWMANRQFEIIIIKKLWLEWNIRSWFNLVIIIVHHLWSRNYFWCYDYYYYSIYDYQSKVSQWFIKVDTEEILWLTFKISNIFGINVDISNFFYMLFINVVSFYIQSYTTQNIKFLSKTKVNLWEWHVISY